jgi:hypothetical protein
MPTPPPIAELFKRRAMAEPAIRILSDLDALTLNGVDEKMKSEIQERERNQFSST